MATKHTHSSIKNADVRLILARDLWGLRRSMRRAKLDMQSDWVMGIRIGLETMSRRMDLYVRLGAGKDF